MHSTSTWQCAAQQHLANLVLTIEQHFYRHDRTGKPPTNLKGITFQPICLELELTSQFIIE